MEMGLVKIVMWTAAKLNNDQIFTGAQFAEFYRNTFISRSAQISHEPYDDAKSSARSISCSNLQETSSSRESFQRHCDVSTGLTMPVSMRGSAFVSFKHETKEEFEQRRALEKEFLFTNEYHDKLVTRGLSDRCAELELERRRHLNFSSPMSHRSTPESSPAGRGSRRPSYETTSPIVHRPAPSPSDSSRRHSYETTSPFALRPPRSSSDSSSSTSDSSIPSTSSSTPASTFRKGVPEWSVRAA